MKFRATVELGGKTATGIEVPTDVVEELGSGNRPAVQVKIGGHTYRTTVGRMGGRFLIPLSAENRTAAGVAAGDDVSVDITLDTAPARSTCRRTSRRPWAPRAASSSRRCRSRIARSACARSRRRRPPETRQRRIAKAVAAVTGADA